MGVSKAAPGLGTSTERRGGRIPLDRQEDNMKTLVSKSSAYTLEEAAHSPNDNASPNIFHEQRKMI